jgi:hypothetical protein
MLILSHLAELARPMDQLSFPFLLLFFWRRPIVQLIDYLGGHCGSMSTGRMAEAAAFRRMTQP